MTTTFFVGHQGQRTGAPLLLLWLIRWLLANTFITQPVAERRHGELGRRLQENVFSSNTVQTQGPRLAQLILDPAH